MMCFSPWITRNVLLDMPVDHSILLSRYILYSILDWTSLRQPSRGSDHTSPTGSSQYSSGGHHWHSPLVVHIIPHQQEAVTPHPGGITGTALSWFKSYLTNRKQSVVIRGSSLGQSSRGSNHTLPTGSSRSSSGGGHHPANSVWTVEYLRALCWGLYCFVSTPYCWGISSEGTTFSFTCVQMTANCCSPLILNLPNQHLPLWTGASLRSGYGWLGIF